MPAAWLAGASLITGIFGSRSASNAAREQARLANEASQRRLWYDTELWEMDAHRLVANHQFGIDELEAKARNEGRIAQWKDAVNIQRYNYDMKIRNREQRSLNQQFLRSDDIYSKQTSLNAMAARAGAEDELRKYQETHAEASFDQQEADLTRLQAEGKARARGASGRSKAKFQQSIEADFGRQMAMLNESMSSAGRNSRAVLQEIQRDKISADLTAYASKMLDPGVLPEPLVPFATPLAEYIMPRKLGEYDFGPEPVLGGYTSPNAAAAQVWGSSIQGIANSAGQLYMALT